MQINSAQVATWETEHWDCSNDCMVVNPHWLYQEKEGKRIAKTLNYGFVQRNVRQDRRFGKDFKCTTDFLCFYCWPSSGLVYWCSLMPKPAGLNSGSGCAARSFSCLKKWLLVISGAANTAWKYQLQDLCNETCTELTKGFPGILKMTFTFF